MTSQFVVLLGDSLDHRSIRHHSAASTGKVTILIFSHRLEASSVSQRARTKELDILIVFLRGRAPLSKLVSKHEKEWQIFTYSVLHLDNNFVVFHVSFGEDPTRTTSLLARSNLSVNMSANTCQHLPCWHN